MDNEHNSIEAARSLILHFRIERAARRIGWLAVIVVFIDDSSIADSSVLTSLIAAFMP